MSDYRKPPVQPQGARPEPAPAADSLDFNLEATTLRLKSLRLRRREQELLEQHQREAERKAEEVKRAVADSVRPSGRVRHDERGMAVWDLAIATGEFSTLSATSALKRLDVGELKIEETTRVAALPADKAGPDKGGGFDPYNQTSQRPSAASRPPRERQGILDSLRGKKK